MLYSFFKIKQHIVLAGKADEKDNKLELLNLWSSGGGFFHPHVHSLILPGIVKDGIFHEQKKISSLVISRLFRARLLKMLQTEGIISQEIVDLLMSWNHNSGFNVHVGGRISGSNEKAIENVARYMSRPAISTDRVKYDPESGTVTVYEKKQGGHP